MIAAVLGLAALMSSSAVPSRLRCLDDGVAVRARVRAQIESAVRRCTRFPVVRLEEVDPKEHAPAGTIVAITVVQGECGKANGDRFWVHRGVRGWRVLKKVGGWGEFSASATGSVR
jgi:hypothetical protein